MLPLSHGERNAEGGKKCAKMHVAKNAVLCIAMGANQILSLEEIKVLGFEEGGIW